MTMIAGGETAVRRAGSDLRRLAGALCLLLAAAFAALGWASAQSAREHQSLQRAEALARSLAMQISNALAWGIPFDRLRGVEAAFEHGRGRHRQVAPGARAAGRMRTRAARLIRWQCSAYHTGSALWPVIQRLERSAGRLAQDSTDRRWTSSRRSRDATRKRWRCARRCSG